MCNRHWLRTEGTDDGAQFPKLGLKRHRCEHMHHSRIPAEHSAALEIGDQSFNNSAVTSPTGVAKLIIKGIEFYRCRISHLKPVSTCRFEPTCSAYGLTAVQRFGAIRGSWLTFLRIMRCAPWHPGGWDPVPKEFPGVGSWWKRMHR